MMKNESIFQAYWLRHAVILKGLYTTNGEEIKVISAGIGHVDQGPDFKNAHIKVGGTEWFGNIEMHLRTSDWFRHGHDKDPTYQNIILHVVWIHDHSSFDICPVLELSVFLSNTSYKEDSLVAINKLQCSDGNIKSLDQEILFLEQLVMSRYERKMDKLVTHIREKNGNVEQVSWELTSRTFGYKVNADCFEELAKSIPLEIVRSYAGDVFSLEALFLGQSGLLPIKPKDEYIKSIMDRFDYLKSKHRLIPIHYKPIFLRMRPMNFPTIRLVQLASLFSRYPDLFDRLASCQTISEIKKILSIEVTPYWWDHNIPDTPSKRISKNIGNQLINSVLLNVLIPLRLALKKRNGKGILTPNDMEWLKMLKPESSHVISYFHHAGFYPINGYETQGLLELYQKKCIRNDCDGCPFFR